MTDTGTKKEKKVRVISADPNKTRAASGNPKRKIRVAAYCRVSTQEEEQLNSYEVQCRYYTEKIENEPMWTFAGIYAEIKTPTLIQFNDLPIWHKRGVSF